MKYDIAFPNLGIFIETLNNSITIHNFNIMYYGIIIAIAMMAGYLLVLFIAKKTKQNSDDYVDLFLIIMICAIIGARAYYVIFNWDYYEIRPYEILDVRKGGLAVFGGIILCIIALIIFCLRRKLNFFRLADTTVLGLLLGQSIGRYGNFFNMEAFGTYTNNIFAMRMLYDKVDSNSVDMNMLMNLINENGVSYVQAHPTFFYESSLNLILLVILLILFFKCNKFLGQTFASYLIGYGLIRFFIEGLRTDSLMFFKTNIRVSQAVALIFVFIGVLMIIYNITPLKSYVTNAIKKKNKENNIKIEEEM